MTAGKRHAWLRQTIAPAVIAILAAVAEAGGEPARLWLRYQREAIGDGEFWRLISGHLVHLGPSHMAMNVVALGVLALIFRSILRPLDWLWACLAAACAIDAGLYWLGPEIEWYVGLSGVLHGLWAAAAVLAWQSDRRRSLVLLALIALKLGIEAVQGPLSITSEVASGPVIAVAHAYGAAGGAFWALFAFAIRLKRRSI